MRRLPLLSSRADVRQTKLESSTGETLRWQQLLTRNRGQVLYVDLWASWCGPCVAEMPASKKVQQALAGKKIVFLYLSVDTDQAKWQQAIVAHGLQQGNTQHYRLDPTAALAKFLKAPPIPRYLLLDKRGQAGCVFGGAMPKSPNTALGTSALVVKGSMFRKPDKARGKLGGNE